MTAPSDANSVSSDTESAPEAKKPLGDKAVGEGHSSKNSDISRGDNKNVPARVGSDQEGEWVETARAQYPLEGGYDGATRNWNAMSRQVWQVARLTAVLLFFALMVGWPIGELFAHRDLYGTFDGWSLWSAWPIGIIFLAFFAPILLLCCGYLLSRQMMTNQAAEAMASAARAYSRPDEVALREVETVGTVVRTQMDNLNTGLDSALVRLADAEAMIRNHVGAIEAAGTAIETQATGTLERVANERTRLIDATETLNARAESFADAIEERTKANVAAMEQVDSVTADVETNFNDRLTNLESATSTALDSFKELLDALGGADNSVRSTTEALKVATDQTAQEAEKTRAAAADMRKAGDDAVSEALSAASNEANQKMLAEAVNQVTAQSSERAVSLAREEAEKIARAAVDQVSVDMEKWAREAGESKSHAAQETLKHAEEKAALADARRAELAATHEALASENTRLETMIEEQRARAERLSKAIAEQSEKLATLSETMAESQDEQRAFIANRNGDANDARSENANSASSDDQSGESEFANGHDVDDAATIATTGLSSASAFFAKKEKRPAESAKSTKSTKSIEDDKRLRSDSGDAKPRNSARGLKLGVPDRSEGPVAKSEPVDDFRSSVVSPKQDLQRLNELARDLSQSRAQNKAPATQDNSKAHSAISGNDQADSTPTGPTPTGLRVNRDGNSPSWKEILAAADGAGPLSLDLPLENEALEPDTIELETQDQAEWPERDISNSQSEMHDEWEATFNERADIESEPILLKSHDGEIIDLMPEEEISPSANFVAQEADLSERELHAFRVINRLQQFTFNLDRRLYGECPPTLIERFERGDRNIFANRLLRLSETDVKKRIRSESARDRKFESDIREFLKLFDSLLEEAALSPSVDEELREYLSSPLGRIYLLIGEIVGYFA